MDTEGTLLLAIAADPSDDTARLALADWLEEQGRQQQGDLLRLHVHLRRGLPGRESADANARINQLLAAGIRPVVPLVRNSLDMLFALIPPGRFWMGSPDNEVDRFHDEGPEHEVEITQPFYLGVFPVTQREYADVLGHNPSYFCASGNGHSLIGDRDTRRHPVENLSWDDANNFCDILSVAVGEGKTGRSYRLPTEAEWEYACRAGLSRMGPFHFGHSLSAIQANFNGRFPYGGGAVGPNLHTTTPVDAYPPNAFGLYDLHGNVSEWCADWFDENYYQNSPVFDPLGPESGDHRVLRGGSWGDDAKYCRAAFRYDRPADDERNDFGVRIVLERS